MNPSENRSRHTKQQSIHYGQVESPERTESPFELDNRSNEQQAAQNMGNAQARASASSRGPPYSRSPPMRGDYRPPPDSVTIFNHTQSIQPETSVSPPPKYPTPHSQQTMDSVDMQTIREEEEYKEYQAWKKRQQEEKLGKPPSNMGPQRDKPDDNFGPSNVHQQMYPYQGHGALAEQRPWPDQRTGPSYQQYHQSQYYPPMRVLPGNKYGKITTSGNAKVIRGNVVDDRTHPAFVREHEYGEAEIGENSTIFEGNIRPEDMKDFWSR